MLRRCGFRLIILVVKPRGNLFKSHCPAKHINVQISTKGGNNTVPLPYTMLLISIAAMLTLTLFVLMRRYHD